MIFIRKCKTCGKDISYKLEITYRRSLISNSDCKTCSALKRKPKTEEVKKQISQTLTGRKMPDEIKMKISRSVKEKFNTQEYKQKFSILHKGENNPMFGKHHTTETLRKIRLNKINRIKDLMRFDAPLYPNYNPTACKIIDEYGKQNGYDFQHAMNGGEYYISELGYWVDGYDKNKNVVLEVDEKHHFNSDGTLKSKDVIRQKEIENELKCKFIRILFTDPANYL